ncbi:TPA: hypothetical protein VCZ18_000231 [Streptococcus pyogenes]|uniref:Phage protein n=2 Tax=root TaxID=1 RepID=A0AB38G4V8_9STRE|nr:hypothetical protein [Streptococcus lutetiensis]DAF53311.1 MAG TPA: hypothetical protein [Siphoviridae sp. ctHjK2]HEP5251315.1 hypothetical protein [Streptococcus pyogenes]MBD8956137.1 hypothetical protein [Streptococcus lutetiensis]MBT0938757.1 hypothetical protein [Streptococcus lutetiensis]MBT0946192.1 hypothetical protein [Streptococcus lutetiensis]
MIRAEIELGGQLEVIDIKAKDKSEAIEEIWRTYGLMTYIISLREVNDETNSIKSDDANKSKGKGD